MSETTINRQQAKEWAQERTLESLLRAVGDSNRILQAISHNRASNIDLSDQLRRESQNLRRSAAELDDAASDLGGSLRRAGRSVSSEFKDYARNIGDTRSLTDQFGRNIKDLSSSLAATKLAGAIPGFRTAVAGIGLALGYGLQQLTQARSVFGGLTQSGLLFNRNVLEFSAEVRGAGLDVIEFGRVAQQYSEGLMMFGEGKFLKSINSFRDTFNRFNITTQEGTEYFAEFLDEMRVSGRGYFMTMEQQESAFKTQIQQQQTIANLTGKSIKKQQEEQRRLQQSERFQAVVAGMSPQEQANLRKVETEALGRGLTAEQFEQLILASRLGPGAVEKGSPFVNMMQGYLGGIGPAAEAIARSVGSGDLDSVTMMFDQISETMKGRIGQRGFFRDLQGLMMTSGPGRDMATEYMRLQRSMLPFMYPRRTAEEAKKEPVDETTRKVNQAISDFEVAIGKLNQQMTLMASQGLTQFTLQLDRLREMLKHYDAGGELKKFVDSIEYFLKNPIVQKIREGISEVTQTVSAATGIPEELVPPAAILGYGIGKSIYKGVKGMFSGGGAGPGAGPSGGGGTPPGGGRGVASFLRLLGLGQFVSAVDSYSKGQTGDALVETGIGLLSVFGRDLGSYVGMGLGMIQQGAKQITGGGIGTAVSNFLTSGTPGPQRMSIDQMRRSITERAESIREPLLRAPTGFEGEPLIYAVMLQKWIMQQSEQYNQMQDKNSIEARQLMAIIERQTIVLEQALKKLAEQQ